MKSLVAIALLALAFTTGFTCSKNTPSPEAPAVQATPQEGQPTADPQEQMAAPAVEPLPPGAGTDGAEAPAPAVAAPESEPVPSK